MTMTMRSSSQSMKKETRDKNLSKRKVDRVLLNEVSSRVLGV
jgi:hypothetical protein